MSLRPDAIPFKPIDNVSGSGADNQQHPNKRQGANNFQNRNSQQQQQSDKPTTEAKLFVGQIPYECDHQRLHELFSAYGNVKFIHILQDGAAGGGRGGRGGQTQQQQSQYSKGRAAFITYESTDEADCAIFTLHNRYRMLTNRPIQVSYAKNSPNISSFGLQNAIEVHNANSSNPLPT